MAGDRAALARAAAAGVAELEQQRQAALAHARARAERMQHAPASALTACASHVQQHQDDHAARRDERAAREASRSASFARHARPDARNERLELVEELTRGPRPYEPRPDDPELRTYEPNARTALRSRRLAHAELEAYLDARYVITPSLFYSLVHRTGSTADYVAPAHGAMDGDLEMPLYGDWVLFAVMGEKSTLRYTAAPADDPPDAPQEGTAFERANPVRPARKFFGCKLLDLNTDVVQKHRQLPGDCVLHMLLFDDTPSQRGAAGEASAFAKLWKEHDGALLAILNPRILKPRKGQPKNLVTVTPRSGDAVLVIGQADAYAQCTARKKDGKRCNAFVVRGTNHEVCDYHLEHAVMGRLRSRMEFASGTARVLGRPNPQMAAHAPPPRRRIPSHTPGLGGLEVGHTSAPAYVVPGGHEMLASSDPRSVGYHVEARYGRERAEREQRKRKADAQEQRIASMDVAPPAAPPAAPDGLEAKFASEFDENSLAAKTLRIAQATLRGEPKPRRNAPHRESDVPRRSSSTARLLARHEAPASSLPKARLRAKKPAPRTDEEQEHFVTL
ncbi:hypothetical protein MBRA1_003385 [Malassezia brasiliensis]|uniref:Zinc finger Mcm10/DnaG-type domain-containing protein n=1 Tax=Malassezia brasiliensis TaxID=1821822 RepID=A0AAF0IPV6_9BASI|nr:hypothetical protein MBRA1_003385 [Malassezia brasiliensis]